MKIPVKSEHITSAGENFFRISESYLYTHILERLVELGLLTRDEDRWGIYYYYGDAYVADTYNKEEFFIRKIYCEITNQV